MKLSLIVPVYNESRTIEAVLDRLHGLQLLAGWDKEVIVVNDCSTDDSSAIVSAWIAQHNAQGTRLVDQEVNKGKGAALARGIQDAAGDYIVFQDGDLELFPEDLNLLLTEVAKDDVDVVFGSRLLTAASKASFTPTNLLANRVLSLLASLLVARKVSDMETCYKMIRRSLMDTVGIEENRFGVEPELTMKLLRDRSISYREVPIRYESRTVEEGKKIGWKDGVRAVYCLFRYRFGGRSTSK